MPLPDSKTPFNALCDDCAHRWVAAYLPMTAVRVADLLKSLHCPNCGVESSRILMVKGDADADKISDPAAGKAGTDR